MGKPPRISIIIATYNEETNILDTISSIFSNVSDPVEIIVVDDDSPDETWKVAGSLGDPRVKVIRRIGARGLASAINRGIIESQGEILGWFDCDMGYVSANLPNMIAKLDECDVTIGSRYVSGGGDQRGLFRIRSSRIINGFSSFVLGYGIRDYDSGFVLFRRSVFEKVTIIPTGYAGFFVEFIYTCCRKGLKVVEMPYVLKNRDKGESKSAPNFFKFLKIGKEIALRTMIARFRRID
jgi:dolichol-phosphate mannosyltransferase